MQEIFYYRHTNNEIYELKFKNVVIDINGRLRDLETNRFNVEYIKAEVAVLGEFTFRADSLSNTLRPMWIFDSVEKAMRGYNNNTLTTKMRGEGKREEDVFKVRHGFKWDLSALMNGAYTDTFILPNHIIPNYFKDIFGIDSIQYVTWKWNGVDAEKTPLIGVKDLAGRNNTYRHLLYDLVSNECIYNTDIVGYATREECVRANHVKVHRF